MDDISFKMSIKCFNLVKKGKYASVSLLENPVLFFFLYAHFTLKKALLSDQKFSGETQGFAKCISVLIISKSGTSLNFRQDSHTCCQERNEDIVYFYLCKINVFFSFTGANFIIPVYYVMKRHL